MVTIATASFPDSDHEDEDFEIPEAQEGDTKETAEIPVKPKNDRKRQRRTEDLWKEMQQEELQSAKRWVKRPCPDQLFRSLQRRNVTEKGDTTESPKRKQHEILTQLANYSQVAVEGQEMPSAREMKQKVRAGSCSRLTTPGSSRVTKAAMLAEVSKYGVSNDPNPSAAEMKKKIRFSREELSAVSGEPVESKMVRATVVQESVRFAGQTLTIERALVPGSAEEQRYLRTQKRRSNAKLGGGLAALDKLLGISRDKELNTMDKSGLDWSRHKEEAGLKDLRRDRRAGALERSAFLQRAAMRAQSAAKAAMRAAARAAGAKAS